VWWYGRARHVRSRQRVTGPDGKSYDTARWEREPPVPGAGIPRAWVLKARRTIAENEWVSNAGRRVWQLTDGVLRFSECGRVMSTNHILSRSGAYYRCAGHYQGGLARCPANRTIRAEKAEAEVWEFVRGILTDPERLAAGLEKMQENEARTGGASAEEEEASWLKRLSEIERRKSA
jgi:hypothetical protein